MIGEVLTIFIVILVIINFFLAFIIWKTFWCIDAGDKEIAKTFHEYYLDIRDLREKIKAIDSEAKLSKEEIEILMTESFANQARLNRLEQFCSSLSQQYAQIFDISNVKDKP